MNTPESYLLPAYRNIGESLIRELAKLMSVPGMVSLAGGYPGPELFDRDGLREAADNALASAPVACLQYGPTDGLPALREGIAGWMDEAGSRCSVDDILVTAGSQQGFDLLVRTLLRPGDVALVERPTYTGPLRLLKIAEVSTRTVGVDHNGLDVDELEAVLVEAAKGQGPRPKLLYVVPTFANPSGATMPLARRLRLLELAVKYGVVVVEDDPYGRLRFHGDPQPHLLSLVDQVPGARDWVVHLGSFSKVIAPGLRTGWLIAAPAIRRACLIAKQLDDLSNPGFTQMTVARYLEAGRLRAHLPVILGAYRERAQAMREAIATHLSSRVAVNVPEGGMFMWGRIRNGASARDLLKHAIDEKVTFVAGDIYYADQTDPATLRLSFSTPTPDQIRTGIARISQALDRLGPA
ncbi:MAG: PLP-dependent aminotransferase family protein [Burkholderiaceae bacterium]|jgi:DNA-binding transcriptional MocR family regulator